MIREWKPGDVAMVTIPGRGDVIAMYMDGGDWETPWAEGDGVTTYEAAPTYSRGFTGRPLVVIDPENREQVERLYDAFNAEFVKREGRTLRGGMQAALREFATPTPPKPAEPTGRYAVVIDADGVEWLRKESTSMWCSQNSQTDSGAINVHWRHYADIAAVDVLSEGVTT